MPQNKAYEDHDTQGSGIVSEFFCYFFIVGIGFPVQIGWVLNAWFGMSGLHLLELSGVLGLLGGIYGAWESCSAKKIKALGDTAVMPHVLAAGETGDAEYPLLGNSQHTETRLHAERRERKDYEACLTPNHVHDSGSNNDFG